MTSRRALLLAAAGVLVAFQAGAATRTWKGPTYPALGRWSDPANWIGGVAPQSGDDLVFPAGRPSLLLNDISPDFTAESIKISDNDTFTYGGYPVRIGAGGLMLTDGGTVTTESATLILAAAQQWRMSPLHSVVGGVDLNGYSLKVFTAGDDFWSVLMGTGSIEFCGSGITRFSFPISATTIPMTISGGWVDVMAYGGPIDVDGGALSINTNANPSPSVGPTRVRNGSISFMRGAHADGLTMLPGSLLSIAALTWYGGLSVTGPVVLDNPALLLSSVAAPTVPKGYQWLIINNDGTDPVQGTFAGLPEGATFVAPVNGSSVYKITYAGGDGNDVVLTYAGTSSTRGTWTILRGSATAVLNKWDLTLNATVKSTSTTVMPTGTITFTEGTAILGTADLSSGQATLTLHDVALGDHVILATYNGDTVYAPSVGSFEQVIEADVPALSGAAAALLVLALALAGIVLVER